MKIKRINENIKIKNTETNLDRGFSKLTNSINHRKVENQIQEDIIIEINSMENKSLIEPENLVYNKEILEKLQLESENIYKETIETLEKLILHYYQEGEDFKVLILPSIIEKALEDLREGSRMEVRGKVQHWLDTGETSELPKETKDRIIELANREIHHIIEKNSNQILDLARSRSQKRTGEILVLKEVIDNSFSNAEEKLEGLSRIVIKIYESTTDKLKDLIYTSSIKENPSENEYFIKILVRDLIIKQIEKKEKPPDLDLINIKKEISDVLGLNEENEIFTRLEFRPIKVDNLINFIMDEDDLEARLFSDRLANILSFLDQIGEEIYKGSLKKLKLTYPKYTYLSPILLPGSFDFNKESRKIRESKAFICLALIFLGLIAYYGLKSLGNL